MRLAPLAVVLLLPVGLPAQKVTLVNPGPKPAAAHLMEFDAKELKLDGNMVDVGGKQLPVQRKGDTLAVLVPGIEAKDSLTVEFKTAKWETPPAEFTFAESKGEHVDVLLGKRPVLRYVNKPRDAKAHYLTFKPFHQVFDPAEGKVMLSSGAYPDPKDGLFPHHRGLFFGFNKCSYEADGKKVDADIWHGTKDVYSTHDKMISTEAGPVFARHAAAISWHGPDGQAFADEVRTVTVLAKDGGTLLTWETLLSTKLAKVRLDGDPQHAGFHFRATQEVSKETAKQTYYLRPDGKGKEGETRNWDSKNKDPKTVNLPWNAMSFVTGGKRYTVVRIPHPDNPKETRGSERDYGRFGDYFEYDLSPQTPLKLKYTLWLQEGEMTVEQCEKLAGGGGKVEVQTKK